MNQLLLFGRAPGKSNGRFAALIQERGGLCDGVEFLSPIALQRRYLKDVPPEDKVGPIGLTLSPGLISGINKVLPVFLPLLGVVEGKTGDYFLRLQPQTKAIISVQREYCRALALIKVEVSFRKTLVWSYIPILLNLALEAIRNYGQHAIVAGMLIDLDWKAMDLRRTK